MSNSEILDYINYECHTVYNACMKISYLLRLTNDTKYYKDIVEGVLYDLIEKGHVDFIRENIVYLMSLEYWSHRAYPDRIAGDIDYRFLYNI